MLIPQSLELSSLEKLLRKLHSGQEATHVQSTVSLILHPPSRQIRRASGKKRKKTHSANAALEYTDVVPLRCAQYSSTDGSTPS